MQLVFDAPVAAYARGEVGSGKRTGRDIGSSLGLDLIAALDAAFDHADGREFGEARGAWIAALGAVPVNDMRDRVEAELEAAMVLADCLELFDLRGRRGVEIAPDVLMQGRLVVLDCQQVVGLGVADRLGDVGIASHGIDRNQSALEIEALYEGWNGGDLIRFFEDGLLSDHQPAVGGEG